MISRVGDNGYPLEPWLITQFSRTDEGSAEDQFNAVHRQMRNCIERVNGVVKIRWRCLSGERMLRYQPKKVVKFANVCCALNNVLNKRGVKAPTLINTDCTDLDAAILNDPDEGRRGVQAQTLYAKGDRNRRRLMTSMAL